MASSTVMFRRRSMDKSWQGNGHENLPVNDDELSKGTQDLFELLEKLQNSRLDDQRCVLPSSLQAPSSHELKEAKNDRDRLDETLTSDGPYPTIILPTSGGYWMEDGSDSTNYDVDNLVSDPFAGSMLETDECARLYRNYFYSQEHFNFIATEENHGHIIGSLKVERIDSQEYFRIIIRTSTGLHHDLIPANLTTDSGSLFLIAKLVHEDIPLCRFTPVLFPKASDLILAFDEHSLVNTFKFGVIYQKFAQTTEEEMFGNVSHSPAMDEFLDMLGDRVELKNFQGFRGGLDTQWGQTGTQSVYTKFEGAEIMFHVSTLLPFSKADLQQLQRKRHIGNDIVTIVFQDSNTPFMPSMIASHFLHSFVVVQVLDPLTPNTRYKVSITSRDDVPTFGPRLPTTSIFKKSPEFRTFLLTKLVNAEIACYKSEKFSQLECRTRCSLLQSLYDKLQQSTKDFCGTAIVDDNKHDVNGSGGGFLDSVRKALTGRNRSHSVESNLAHSTTKRSSSSNSNSSLTSTITPTGDTTPTTARAHNSKNLYQRSPSQSSTNSARSSKLDEIRRHSEHNSNGIGHNHYGFRLNGSNPGTPASSPSTPPLLQPKVSESDSSSLSSLEIEKAVSADETDLEAEKSSMTEISSFRNSTDSETSEALDKQFELMFSEINKLKSERAELRKQNMTLQREVKKVKEKEVKLSAELFLTKREVDRLQSHFAKLNNGHELDNV